MMKAEHRGIKGEIKIENLVHWQTLKSKKRKYCSMTEKPRPQKAWELLDHITKHM